MYTERGENHFEKAASGVIRNIMLTRKTLNSLTANNLSDRYVLII